MADAEELIRKYAVKNALDYGEAQKDSVIGNVFGNHPELKEDAGAVVAQADPIIEEVNNLSQNELEAAAEAYEYDTGEDADADQLPDLPDAEDGDVVLRFAPNPNGPPTLGSSRGMVINGELKEKYDGTLILRFDDTDPRTKRPLRNHEHDAYEMYQEDYEWLGYDVDEVIYSSERFETYFAYAERLIEMGNAYVCFCSPEEGRTYREQGEPCPHRDTEPAKNLAYWEQMKDGGIEEGEATLKIKTDMQHKNPAIRDWVAFRIIEDPDHPRTFDRYRVWPLLDFQSAIEDHESGVTHIVRGKDLRASTKRQKYLYDYLDWNYPHVRYWGRVNIHGLETPMSTSTLRELIEDGELDGWDDPRAPTLRSLRKRGFTPDAIRGFWREMGVTENDVEASMDTLHSFNRKTIDRDADRYFFVANPVMIEIHGVEDELVATIPLHPEEDRGERKHVLIAEEGTVPVYIEEDDMVDGFLRLKDLCNVDIWDGETKLHSFDHTEAIDRNADIVQWVPQDGKPCTVHMPDGETIDGRCEPDVPEGVVQFVRFGFVNITDTGDTVDAYYTHS